MRVLWFAGVRKSGNNRGYYGGGGWIRSLREEIIANTDIVLAQSFLYDADVEPWSEDNVMQYPMYVKPLNRLKKLYNNWIGWKKEPFEKDVNRMLKVIDKFKPDVIHIFGNESSYPAIQNYTNIPVVIYIQGLLNPISNAFYPPGINKWSFLFNCFNKQEWLMNNGFGFQGEIFKRNAKRDAEFLNNAKYIIGRTPWDYKVVKLFAPKAKYFVLPEMMRTEFYSEKIWDKKPSNNFVIYTTISNVTYKGLDLILKTAKILKSQTNLTFEWNVAGISKDSSLIKFFEREFGISSNQINVNYKGVVSSDKLYRDLLESDVLVHPSYIDNGANSVCEAQLLGLPVIACYVGGVRSLIEHNKTGILVPANDPYELAFTLNEAAMNDTLKSFSENARIVALKRHNRKDILQKLIEIYTEISK
jgi:glycosyltransferase involved in cell wall biosynthesis